MDVSNLLKNVKTLSDYITVSQDLKCKYNNAKVEFNMSVVFVLKNIRSLEIEFFHKCDDTGAAFIIFEQLLLHPSSKTWSLLGKELVFLLQYWLEAVRKHLINHHVHWWSFFSNILDFVKALLKKDGCFYNLLAEYATDSFLDLATRGKLDMIQRYTILHTFNLFSAECSKELRQALRSHFEHYFVRLAAIMATCGHVPTQHCIMEALLRWLVRRREVAARRDAAEKWLPQHLYTAAVAKMFVERPWKNFCQDARDFLNAHNDNGDLVTSVVCRKLTVGDHVIVQGGSRRQFWLDLSVSSRCVTAVLEPSMLAALDAPPTAPGMIALTADNAIAAKLHRESSEVTISVSLSSPPLVYPSGAGAGAHVAATIGPEDLLPVDKALRTIFLDKYQLQLDLHSELISKPERGQRRRSTEEVARFSHSPNVRRRKHAGYIIKSNRPLSLRSPSTASTSSLAQLHDKLAALPRYIFDKEPVVVCITPSLSEVTEVTETELNNTASTLKLRHFDYVTKRFRINKNSQSDTELLANKATDSSGSTDKRSDTTLKLFPNKPLENKPKNFRDEIIDEDSTSRLLVTTLGSADQSVINDTLERLSKHNECRPDNIVDLLVKEALQPKCDVIESGNNKKNSDCDSDVIENTYTSADKANKKKDNCKSTSDESNTEAINDTQINYVNVTKRSLQRKRLARRNSQKVEVRHNENLSFDIQAVEDFFSRHISQNVANDEIVISPTLAKKINETSSECSDFDEYVISNIDYNTNFDYEMQDVDVIECLNDMVDKVCNVFDKCSEYLNRSDIDNKAMDDTSNLHNVLEPLKDIVNIVDEASRTTTKSKPKSKSKNKNIPLNITFAKKKTQKMKPLKNKLKLEPTSKMSTIPEVHNEISDGDAENDNKKEDTISKDPVATPLLRRKRKLYSPKAVVLTDSLQDDKRINKIEDNNSEEDLALSEYKKLVVTPKTSATASSYKDIEKDRRNYRNIRSKRSTGKKGIPVSPKTKKNDDMFDKLKESIDTNEKITFADKKACDKDIGIFNFTSDSEDEEFKQKKIELQKRMSSTTIDSGNSMISCRRRLRTKTKYTENANSADESKTTNVRKRKCPPRRKIVPKIKNDNVIKSNIKYPIQNLIDERMREAPKEELDTSFVVAVPNKKSIDELPDPAILVPEIEMMTDNEAIHEITDAVEKDKVILEAENIDRIETIEKICESKTKIDNEDKKEVVVEKTEKKANKKVLRSKTGNGTKNNNKKKAEEVSNNENRKVATDIAKSTELDNDDNRTISPLPGLLVETVTKYDAQGDDSLTTNMELKFKRIYQKGPDAMMDTDTTQNLLSDFDRSNITAPITTDEINDRIENNFNIVEERNEMFKTYTDTSGINNIEKDTIKDDVSVTSSKAARRNRSLSLKTKGKPRKGNEGKFQNESSFNLKNAKLIKLKTNELINNKESEVANDLTLPNENNLTAPGKKQILSDHKSHKTINVSDITELKSEKSLDTVGITAHGEIDDNEPAADLKTLEESFTPRDLSELEGSLKDFCNKLRNQINNSDRSESKESPINGKDSRIRTPESVARNCSKERKSSPVVSICRTATDEIMKWISQKPEKKRNTRQDDDITRYLPSRRNSESNESEATEKSSLNKSPIVPIKRLSPIEIAKWTSPKNVYPKRKRLTSPIQFTNTRKERKSIISPIKLFEEIKPRSKRNYSTSQESYKNFAIDTSNSTKKSPSVPSRYFLRNISNNSTPESKISTSTRIEVSGANATPKRTLEDNDSCNRRRRLAIDTQSSLSTAPSGSSVDVWFRNKQPKTNRGVNVELTLRDAVENVMERLDTTLAEIHQKTTENFIELFVDARRHLNTMKEERKDAYRKTASKISQLHAVLDGLNEDIVDLDNRSQEMEHNFTEWMKRTAAGFIHSDRDKKKTMVAMLREDLQAIIDHTDRINDQ